MHDLPFSIISYISTIVLLILENVLNSINYLYV